MAGRLEGRVALITGAARGQGRAEAVRLAEEGASIVALDVCGPIAGRDLYPASSPADLAETVALVEAAGQKAVAIEGDTRRLADLQRAVDEGLSAFGRLDIAVANAGIPGSRGLLHEISEDGWQTTIDVDLTGVWHTAKAVLPTMIEAGRGGCIVLTSSAAASRIKEQLGDYGAAKAAVNHLCRTLALENGRHGIRVNAIEPGFVATPMVINEATLRLYRPDLDHPTREDAEPMFADKAYLKVKPLLAGRDIANAVLWLASDEGAFVTGAVVPVDMGWIP
ncbi:MAG TPA: mycofactocin-coupled SDR family oxidoreductase [Acidimicrobiales bacterium]|nr:mycofactocin-coupled SDR family oxidoreductase [Acidimicrobiales bacterium]